MFLLRAQQIRLESEYNMVKLININQYVTGDPTHDGGVDVDFV